MPVPRARASSAILAETKGNEMKIAIEASYTAYAQGIVDLPDGKTWDDVEHVSVRYSTVSVQFKGEPNWTELDGEVELNDGGVDTEDPNRIMVYAVIGEDEPDHSRCLDDVSA
jgi:hypothetical protein